MEFKYIPFPDPEKSDNEGLVAFGGDLSRDMLISAYIQGLFPWYNEPERILWWSPNPRMILYPEKLKVSKSLHQSKRNENISILFDHDFRNVILNCANIKRKNQKGTWIIPEIIDSYTNLYEEGVAHSVEVYYDDKLCGGLYGLSIGKVFFGESMFFLRRDASKIALYHLCDKLKSLDFNFIDVQQSTAHLKSLGAENISRSKFLSMLSNSINEPFHFGKWC